MTTARIFFTRPDGGISVVCPAPKFMARFLNQSLAMAAVRARSIPRDTVAVWEGNIADLPYRGSFRNAWRQGPGPSIVMDMVEARVIKMGQIRVERDEKLDQADDDLKVAQDDGNLEEENLIRERRKILRDLPATIQFDLGGIVDPAELDVFEPVWPK